MRLGRGTGAAEIGPDRALYTWECWGYLVRWLKGRGTAEMGDREGPTRSCGAHEGFHEMWGPRDATAVQYGRDKSVTRVTTSLGCSGPSQDSAPI